MKSLIFIPARYQSSRFPGKPLADILGKPMIERVYDKARRSKKAERVVVATDDLRIYSVVKDFGGNVVMTSPEHQSGTDRITEAAEQMSAEIFINLQGDQPLICPENIDILIDKMVKEPSCEVATLCQPISRTEAENPNTVKVVKSAYGKALYFSRSLIPYDRDDSSLQIYHKHVGIYGYRRHIIKQYNSLPYSRLEHQEKLEQLRLMEAGFSIDVLTTDKGDDQGVDTPEDLEIVKNILRGRQAESSFMQDSILQK